MFSNNNMDLQPVNVLPKNETSPFFTSSDFSTSSKDVC